MKFIRDLFGWMHRIRIIRFMISYRRVDENTVVLKYQESDDERMEEESDDERTCVVDKMRTYR